MSTIADVFIIETLDPDDEGNGRFEGSNICHVLKLHGKSPEYRYVRTRQQLKRAIAEFGDSNYRYLHISTHGDDKGMCTTNLDDIDFEELADLLDPALQNRRLFLSACEMVNENMARAIMPTTDCRSIVGPTQAIEFTVSAVFWPTLYHLLFNLNDSSVRHAQLSDSLSKLVNLFEIDIGYFSRSESDPMGFKRRSLK